MKHLRVKALVLGTMFLLGSAGFGFSQDWNPDSSRQGAAKYSEQKQQIYKGSIAVARNQTDENYAEMPANPEKMAKISLQQAMQATAAANPGTSAVGAGLGNENGFLVYSVSLNNGLDVEVDAGTGQIVHTEKASTDQEHHVEERSSEEENSEGEKGSEGGEE